MARKRHKAEKIVGKLRQLDVLKSQDRLVDEAMRNKKRPCISAWSVSERLRRGATISTEPARAKGP